MHLCDYESPVLKTIINSTSEFTFMTGCDEDFFFFVGGGGGVIREGDVSIHVIFRYQR